MAKRCMSPKAAKWMVGIASVGLAFAIAVLCIFPSIYKRKLADKITLADGSLATDVWKDIPLPIYERLFFFNITNGDAFLKDEEPLNVTEVGPYVYQGKWVKPEPIWHPNGTVSFRETRTWQFVRDLSVGGQDDSIYTLNGPMIIGAHILKPKNFFLRWLYSKAMKFEKETVVTQKRIRELVYDGYEDPIILFAPIIKKNLPFKHGIFSWLYGKNATNDGLFTVYTGVENASLTNVIQEWNGNETMNYWKGDSCNKISGTNVEMGPPLPETPETYSFFQSIFCRSLTYNFTGDTSAHGIPLKRFEPTPMLFANSTENPDNECFELQGERPSGVLDISPCQFDAPVFLSFPHFHMADPSYLNTINGLDPNPNKHGSYVDAEPITGITMNISIKFQLNLQLERVAWVSQVENIPEGLFPLFWVDITIQLSEEWADYFRGQLNNPKYIAYSILGFVTLACLVMIIVGAIIITRAQQDEDHDCLLNTDEDKKYGVVNNHVEPSTIYEGEGNRQSVNATTEQVYPPIGD